MEISTISKTILTLILSIFDIRTSNMCAYFLFKFVHKSCFFFTLSTIEIADASYRKSISNTVARLTVFIVETPKSIGTKGWEERRAAGNKIQNASFPCFQGFRTHSYTQNVSTAPTIFSNENIPEYLCPPLCLRPAFRQTMLYIRIRRYPPCVCTFSSKYV